MNYKNVTAYLLRFSLPFYYWQSHLPVWFCCRFPLHIIRLSGIRATLENRQDRSMDYVLARRMTRISAAKIICIHNKLIKSQSSQKATHFRGQLFQLLDIFRFFDFLFGGSLTALVLFSYNRNAAFFTNVSLAHNVSAMWFKDKPRFLYIITFHLSEIANYFVIITWRLCLIQRRSNIALKRTQNMNTTIVMDTFDWRPPKLRFWNGKKIVEGRVWLVTAVTHRHVWFLQWSPDHMTFLVRLHSISTREF